MFYRIQRCTNKLHKIPINILHSYIRKMATESSSLETVELQLPQGRIRGAKRESIYGHNYYSFEGIPYGQPPIGALRFRAPKPFGKWTGTLDGTRTPLKPVQKNMRTGQVEGSENCLFLNVFTKSIDIAEKLPVMVWIYGGGFQTGRAAREHHGPDYFMRENVVIVSMNYRLCSLGFLSLSDPKLDVPGNAGIKDQLLALKWVKQNIYYFNGNCNNITVFGESSGAASTHILSLTEQARGLFQQGILMSGCALNYWTLSMPRTDMAYRLAKYHGYEGDNEDSAVLTYLENLDAKKLVDHALLNDEEKKNFNWLTFTPTIEPYIADHCVLPTNPLNMLSTAWSNNIPFLVGGTSYEGLVMYPRFKRFPEILDLVNKEPELIVPAEVREVHTDCSNIELGKRILQLYSGGEKDDVVAQQLKEDPMYDLMHLCSHKMFWHGLHRTALARIKYATANTFLYRFDFDSPTFNHHRLRFCGDDCVRGAAHADDLSYIFYLNESSKLEEDSEEYQTIQRMVGMWTSFAKLGDPNCAEIEPNTWLPIKQDSPNTALNISQNVQVMQVPDAPKLEAWDSLYDKKMLYGPDTLPVWDI